MRCSQILALGLLKATHAYEIDIKEAVSKGIIRHFDHITDLPSSQWYRVPQPGDTYLEFQNKQFENSKTCDQSTDDLEYNIEDPYVTEGLAPYPRHVSDLSWPQAEGTLLRNVYPQYMAIHGGVRQFCVLRRYFAKTIDGSIDEPRDKEWGPYRCTHIMPLTGKKKTGYAKVISLRSGPHRKYKPIMNLVDIRSQADYFGPMHQQLALDSEDIKPVGKWQNNRPITNFTRNEILEKYNVKKFYNSEHEIFNDNSRLRLLADRTIRMRDQKRKGQIWEVDTMIPTYSVITGGPYETNVMTSDVDTTWVRRNLVPNYITRSHKGGFMRTGNILHDNNLDVIYTMDYPGYSRYCCTNSAAGFEGYNPEDTRRKGVGYMFQPSFAPFYLAMATSTCDGTSETASEDAASCSEVYKPYLDFEGIYGGDLARMGNIIQLQKDNGEYFQTASDSDRETVEQRGPKHVEPSLFAFLYSGNIKRLIKSYPKKTFEESFGNKYYAKKLNKYESRSFHKNWFWELDSYMFDKACVSEFLDAELENPKTIVTVNYQCSANQYIRNVREKTDATSYMSPYPDYQDAWSNPPYNQFVGSKLTGFMVDIFESDKYYSDFENFAPRFSNVACNVPLNLNADEGDYGSEGQCQFPSIEPDSIEYSYAYNQYYHEDQRKHTIKDMTMTEGDCTSITVTVEVDCGNDGTAATTAGKTTPWVNVDGETIQLFGELDASATSVKETNYWVYQKECSAKAWKEIYNVMFQPDATADDTWKTFVRDEYNN